MTDFKDIESIYRPQSIVVETKLPGVAIDLDAIFNFLRGIRQEQQPFKVPVGSFLEVVVEPHRQDPVVDQMCRRLHLKRGAFIGWQPILAQLGWKITSLGTLENIIQYRIPHMRRVVSFSPAATLMLPHTYTAFIGDKYIEINGPANATKNMAIAFKGMTWGGAFKSELQKLAFKRKDEFDIVITELDLDSDATIDAMVKAF